MKEILEETYGVIVYQEQVMQIAQAVAGDGKPLTPNLAGAAAVMLMPVCVPVIVEVTVSVAVIDRVPAVFKVALKV